MLTIPYDPKISPKKKEYQKKFENALLPYEGYIYTATSAPKFYIDDMSDDLAIEMLNIITEDPMTFVYSNYTIRFRMKNYKQDCLMFGAMFDDELYIAIAIHTSNVMSCCEYKLMRLDSITWIDNINLRSKIILNKIREVCADRIVYVCEYEAGSGPVFFESEDKCPERYSGSYCFVTDIPKLIIDTLHPSAYNKFTDNFVEFLLEYGKKSTNLECQYCDTAGQDNLVSFDELPKDTRFQVYRMVVNNLKSVSDNPIKFHLSNGKRFAFTSCRRLTDYNIVLSIIPDGNEKRTWHRMFGDEELNGSLEPIDNYIMSETSGDRQVYGKENTNE